MNYSEREKRIIVADSLRELNYKQKKLLLASEEESNPDREKYAAALIKIAGGGVYTKIKEKFRDLNYREGVLASLEKRKVACVTVKSANYPESLKQIEVPPLVLYLRGNAELLGKRLFAVVGSRRTTAQIMAKCTEICSQLSESVAVVTGVADGADSAAVKGGLKTGNIICVLPGGHDGVGAANPRLLGEVEEKGLSISEFPPLTPAQKYTFVLRNRVIAGLAEGVLVVSAPDGSGALSTAGYAADYSKDVFAFPYNLGVPTGEGCNQLIKNGANLCTCPQDILGAMGIKSQQKSVSLPKTGLDGDEDAVIKFLTEEGEQHAETIAARLQKTLTQTLTVCSMLEIKGLIVRVGGNKFAVI